MRGEPTTGLRRLQPIQKAARLLAEGRVRPQPDARVYLVAGEHDNYQVIADLGGIRCPCPATTPLCSHALAVMQMRGAARVRPLIDEQAATDEAFAMARGEVA